MTGYILVNRIDETEFINKATGHQESFYEFNIGGITDNLSMTDILVELLFNPGHNENPINIEYNSSNYRGKMSLIIDRDKIPYDGSARVNFTYINTNTIGISFSWQSDTEVNFDKINNWWNMVNHYLNVSGTMLVTSIFGNKSYVANNNKTKTYELLEEDSSDDDIPF